MGAKRESGPAFTLPYADLKPNLIALPLLEWSVPPYIGFPPHKAAEWASRLAANYFLEPDRGFFNFVCRALRLLRLGLLMRNVPLP